MGGVSQMKIKVQVAVESDDGQSKVVQEIAQLERGDLRPEELGLTLAEAKAILASIQRVIAEQQAAEFVARQQRCPGCGQPCHHKGHRPPLGFPGCRISWPDGQTVAPTGVLCHRKRPFQSLLPGGVPCTDSRRSGMYASSAHRAARERR